MLDQSPKHVLRRFYEAEATYMKAKPSEGPTDFTAMRKTLSEDVVLHQSPDLPFGGEYLGHQGYEQWAIAMKAIFDKLEVSEQQFFEAGDKVVVFCRFTTRSRLNGLTQDFPMVQVVTVNGGLITDFRPFYWNVPAYSAAAQGDYGRLHSMCAKSISGDAGREGE